MTQPKDNPVKTNFRDMFAQGKCSAYHLLDVIEDLQETLKEKEQPRHSSSIGVGDGSGDLILHGSYDAVKVCQRKLLELEELRRSRFSDNELALLSLGMVHSGTIASGGEPSPEIRERVYQLRPDMLQLSTRLDRMVSSLSPSSEVMPDTEPTTSQQAKPDGATFS